VFSESAELYDAIYSEFKDFEGEARQVAGWLKVMAPGARTLLDVGCGTGRHAETLVREFGYEVDGLDVEPGFLDIARGRCPGGSFSQGDMADFDLGKSYDAVLCLFSSIGYVKTEERLRATARNFFRHLAPGGVALVEPWFAPGELEAGRTYLTTVEGEERTIARMSQSRIQGGVSRLDFHYLVGTPEGIRHLEEVHELGLFTTDQMLEAFRHAGFSHVEFDEEGLIGRGVYRASASSTPERGK